MARGGARVRTGLGRAAAAMLGVAALGLAPPDAVSAPATPAEATVYIRVTGRVRTEYQRAWKQAVEREGVEIATGSGFAVSPFGHVLTSRHLVASEGFTLGGEVEVSVRPEVERIEVVFAGETGERRFEASVVAEDPDLDLALLSVSGADLPYLSLGDSDALEAGQPVEVLGFPFGRKVEVGRGSQRDAMPAVTVSRGSVSALRAGDDGEARYIQTDASVNPGSSGGPMVDAEGYVVGVIRMKLGQAAGVGFGVPVNRVKDFLEEKGQEALFPGRRLRLGPPFASEWKRLRLRMPEGLEDLSRGRLRLEAGARPEEVGLSIDRLATDQPLTALEPLLLSGRVFEDFEATGGPSVVSAQLGGRPALLGSARGAPPHGAPPLGMEYALLDLGREKLVARYVGPAAQVAFNRAVLRASLRSLEAGRLLTAELREPIRVSWEPAGFSLPGAPALLFPSGWGREPTPPLPCRGMPSPDAVLSASPTGDFTVAFRAAFWSAPTIAASDAAAACGARPGETSYARRAARLAEAVIGEGLFLATAAGLVQVEVESPPSKQPFVGGLLRAWAEAQPQR